MTTAEILLLHQGPFFDGTVSRCQCRHIVQSGRDWANHVAEQLQAAT